MHLTLIIFLRLINDPMFIRRKAVHVAHGDTNSDIIFLWYHDHNCTCTPTSRLFNCHDYTCIFQPFQVFLRFVHQWQSRHRTLIAKGWASSLRAILVLTFHLAKTMEETWVFCTIVGRALDRLHSADQMQLIYNRVVQQCFVNTLRRGCPLWWFYPEQFFVSLFSELLCQYEI